MRRLELSHVQVRPGELLVVAGPARSGKSRLLDLASHSPVPLVRIEHAGKPTLRGAVFDGRRSVATNLLTALEGRGDAEQFARLFGLEHLLGCRPHDLSAEQRRRLAVAVAAASGPRVMLLDEPTRGLEPEAGAALDQSVRRAVTHAGLTAVLATSDPDEALAIGDRIAFVEAGEIRQVGTPGELAVEPATAEVMRFLGRDRINLLPGRLLEDEDEVELEGGGRVPVSAPGAPRGRDVLVGVWSKPSWRPSAALEAVEGAVASPDAVEALAAGATPDPADVALFDAETRSVLAREPPAHPRADHGAEPQPASAARVVNVSLALPGAGVVPPERALKPGTVYALRFGIGRRRRDSVVQNAKEHAFPPLPRSEAGHEIDVVVTGGEISVAQETHRLRLPNLGDTRQRSVKIRLPAQPGSGTIRLAFYWRQHLLQSVMLYATWGRRTRASHYAIVDYSLSDLDDVGRVPERDLSLLLNESADGRHRFIVNHRDEDPFVVKQPSEAGIGTRLREVRRVLLAAHRAENGETRYEPNNGKKPPKLYADLAALASAGSDLLMGVLTVPALKRLYAALRDAQSERPGEVAIQILPAPDRGLLFPWHAVYDLPYETGKPKKPCPFIAQLDFDKPAPEFPPECPEQDAHGENVICPYGFWGFKYLLEVPPPLDGGNLPLCVRDGPPAAKVALGVALNLDPQLTAQHLGRLPAPLDDFDRCESVDAFKAQLASDRELVYLYCHGRREPIREGGPVESVLQIGKKDVLVAGNVVRWAVHHWPHDHWTRARPLVFINGCETAALSPADPGDFVDAFVGAGASGVVGTEIPMEQPVASEVAEELLRRLVQPDATVGAALRGMRQALLAKGNVMGLAYTAYCSADLTFRCDAGT